MCLSAVYTEEVGESSVIVEEASSVIASDDGSVKISTLFGEEKHMKGYLIKEVNLLKNYIVLEQRGGSDG